MFKIPHFNAFNKKFHNSKLKTNVVVQGSDKKEKILRLRKKMKLYKDVFIAMTKLMEGIRTPIG